MPAATLTPPILVSSSAMSCFEELGDQGGRQRRLSGVANAVNVVDSYGTHFTPGAWTAGGLDDKPYAFLWMHDPYNPVGIFTASEDERGLVIDGVYDETDEGQRRTVAGQAVSAGPVGGLRPPDGRSRRRERDH